MSFRNYSPKTRPFSIPEIEMEPVMVRGLTPEIITDIAVLFSDDIEEILALILEKDGSFSEASFAQHGPYIGKQVNQKVPEVLNVIGVVGTGHELGSAEFEKEIGYIKRLPLAARYELALEVVRMTMEAEGGLGKLFAVLRLALGERAASVMAGAIENFALVLKSSGALDRPSGLGSPSFVPTSAS